MIILYTIAVFIQISLIVMGIWNINLFRKYKEWVDLINGLVCITGVVVNCAIIAFNLIAVGIWNF